MKNDIYKIIILVLFNCLVSSCNNTINEKKSKLETHNEVGFELFQVDTAEKTLEDSLIGIKKGSSNVNFFNGNCLAILNPLYTTFKAQDDHQLILALDELYTLDREKYNNRTSSSGLSGWTPSYGGGNYNSGKSNVASLKEKYRGQTNFRLNEDDHRQIQLSFVDQDVAKEMYESFNRCNDANQYLPKLTLVSNNKTKVVCNLYLPFSRNTSTRINSIVSSNLKLNTQESDIGNGSRVRYGTPYNIVFERKTDNQAGGEIIIAIQNEQPLTISYSSLEVVGDIVYNYRFMSSDENGNAYKALSYVTFNHKDKTITHRDINGKNVVQKWNKKAPVSGKILTRFNSDQIIISGVHAEYDKNIKYVNWSLLTYPGSKTVDIQTTIKPNKKKSTVKFTIYYKKLTKICVRNCPDDI